VRALRSAMWDRFLLVYRSFTAVLVAAVASFATLAAVLYPLLPQYPEDVPLWLLRGTSLVAFLLVGFAGVFSGVWCLPRAYRKSGSVVLLFVGLGFFTWMTWLTPNDRGSYALPFEYIGIIPLAVGGCLAVFVVSRISLTRHWSEPL
jgi:hypothetical protein